MVCKKLLILAGSCHEIDLVLRAKERGIYTIVTDMYDTQRSPAKLLADEYWNVSWSDIDELAIRCTDEKVDGVIGGYSEIVVENVIKLTKRLGLPCFSTMDQLDVTRDKIKFKEACRTNSVPVVHEYLNPADVTSFPVIVKPTDRAGSIGISVANNPQELDKSYAYAMKMSLEKKVIIEDFISNGTKFDSYYAVVDGKATFLTSNDTVNARNNGTEKVIQSAWTLPSIYEAAYLRQEDGHVREMIKALGIKNGYLFFSAFAIPKDGGVDFVFFECGFRLSGGHFYKYVSAQGNPDYQDIFINSALGIKENLEFIPDRFSDLRCAVVNYYAKQGVIGEISGIEEISDMEDCTFALKMAREGQECHDDKAILTKVAMFHFMSRSIEALRNDVEKCHKFFACVDVNGRDMVFDRVEPNDIF